MEQDKECFVTFTGFAVLCLTHCFAPTNQADWACLLANTSEGKPHQNKSLIVVPMDTKGITKSAISKMGMHVSIKV